MKRDLIPDPTRYYVKDDPVFTTAYYPELSTIILDILDHYILVLVLLLRLKLHQHLMYPTFINMTFVSTQSSKQKTN